ncbi:hypothetical protein ACTOB_001232 [Actinoplanes oblitus]|uniref:Uncharacterized protein n=1 Tax=Actinoplanes oblitus TaxID=3040509 RepID=A0ABY8WIJ4_9ACTN|nr:hypothetical protein [Actinoplanes oblitus]WIM97684.1 hypothetical protein ACTOB_001232 [Actinoplanes oblitus]
MGYRLRREVRDAMPKGTLTHKEVRLVLELADSCNDDTREGWPGLDWLADVCDIGDPKKVGETLGSIAKKWHELRVPVGKDKRGLPTFAREGQRMTFRFPKLAARPTVTEPAPSSPPETGDLNTDRAPQKQGTSRSPKTGDLSSSRAPLKQGTLELKTSINPPQPRANEAVTSIAAALSIEEEEATAVFQKILTEKKPGAPSRYVAHLIQNGDIRQFHTQPRPKPTYAGPLCDYTDDGHGRCHDCGLPAGNARHAKAA